jgi:hypothetical protein
MAQAGGSGLVSAHPTAVARTPATCIAPACLPATAHAVRVARAAVVVSAARMAAPVAGPPAIAARTAVIAISDPVMAVAVVVSATIVAAMPAIPIPVPIPASGMAGRWARGPASGRGRGWGRWRRRWRRPDPRRGRRRGTARRAGIGRGRPARGREAGGRSDRRPGRRERRRAGRPGNQGRRRQRPHARRRGRHVGSPPAKEIRGVEGALASLAVDRARTQGARVRATSRHPAGAGQQQAHRAPRRYAGAQAARSCTIEPSFGCPGIHSRPRTGALQGLSLETPKEAEVFPRRNRPHARRLDSGGKGAARSVANRRRPPAPAHGSPAGGAGAARPRTSPPPCGHLRSMMERRSRLPPAIRTGCRPSPRVETFS